MIGRHASFQCMAWPATPAAAGALAWAAAEWVSRGKPSVLGTASGAVAGLVAITAWGSIE